MSKMEKILARQKAIVDGAKNDGNRDLTAAEQTEFDQLQTDLEALRAANPEPVPTPTPVPTNPQDNERAIQLERERITSINELFRSFGEDPDEFSELLTT